MGIRIIVDPGHYANYNRSPVVKDYYEGNQMWKLSQYLIEELKKYNFEKVSCTKPSINDYPKYSKGDDIYTRGTKAKGYDVMLSIHSNACDTESVNRAVVIYPINNDGKGLADKLGATIKTVMGLSSHQIYSKKGSNGNYYGVIRGAAAVGVPALILEHGFHTNTAVARWLMSDTNLKKLAEAEAKVVAAHYGVALKKQEKVEEEMTQEQFNKFMDNWLAERAAKEPSQWSEEDRKWAEANGIIQGDGEGMKYQSFCTREQIVAILHRLYLMGLK